MIYIDPDKRLFFSIPSQVPVTKARNGADFVAGPRKAQKRQTRREKRAAKDDPKIGDVPVRSPKQTRKRAASAPKHDSSGSEGDLEDEKDSEPTATKKARRRRRKSSSPHASENVSKLSQLLPLP